MKLVHLTAAQNIPSIQAQGLKPAAVPRDGFSPHWPHGCVWFTRELRELKVTWWDDPSLYACFVLVVLPASDKRLMSLERWLRDHLSPDHLDKAIATLNQFGSGWRSHYLYFGIVPPHRIKAVGKTVSTPPADEQEAA